MKENPVALKILQGPRDNVEDSGGSCHLQLSPMGQAVTLDILAVLDGVGGHSFGEIASSKALSHLMTCLSLLFQDVEGQGPKSFQELMIQALEETNRYICSCQQEAQAFARMSTTAVVAVVYKNNLIIGWAGDSRCYCYRDSHLRQLTEDHSVVQAMIKQGLLTPELAAYSPYRHVINQCIGSEPKSFSPSVVMRDIHPGDLLLLSSDGLSDVVEPQQISAVLEETSRGHLTLDQAADQLTQMALEANTTDNVTALVYRYGDSISPYANISASGTYPAALQSTYRNLQMKGHDHE